MYLRFVTIQTLNIQVSLVIVRRLDLLRSLQRRRDGGRAKRPAPVSPKAGDRARLATMSGAAVAPALPNIMPNPSAEPRSRVGYNSANKRKIAVNEPVAALLPMRLSVTSAPLKNASAALPASGGIISRKPVSAASRTSIDPADSRKRYAVSFAPTLSIDRPESTAPGMSAAASKMMFTSTASLIFPEENMSA